MNFKLPQSVLLCTIIIAVGLAHSASDASYLEAKTLLEKCGNFNSPQDIWKAQECYENVIKLCNNICPPKKCPIKVTNIKVEAKKAIKNLDLRTGPPPGAEACSCEMGEEDSSIADEYNYLVQNNSSDAVAWNDRGAFFAEKCCFDEALRSFDEAIHLNSLLAEPWYNKGVLIYEEDPVEALECFNQTIEIDPEFAEAWFNRCSILLSFEIDPESPVGLEAQRSYDQALEFKPELGDYNPPYLDFKRME